MSSKNSVIDFLLFSYDLLPFYNELNIDDKRKYTLTRFGTENGKQIVKESDHNLRVMFGKANINSIAHSLIAGDLKAYNLLLAMTNNASKFPCGFCKGTRFEGLWIKGDLRTLEEMQNWEKNGLIQGLKSQLDYFNCIGVPIVWTSSETETYVTDKFAIPTLHCILGICNRVYNFLEENCPYVESFSKKLGQEGLQ